MASILNDALRRQLAAPAVYAHLIFNCFDLFEHTAKDIEAHWDISSDHAYRLGVRSCPTLLGNLISSQDCVERFGVDTVSRVPGFYSFNRVGCICTCLEWNNFCVCDLETWRLDLDWLHRGLIVPQLNARGHFISLRVFRHAKDSRPFTLRVRTEAVAA